MKQVPFAMLCSAARNVMRPAGVRLGFAGDVRFARVQAEHHLPVRAGITISFPGVFAARQATNELLRGKSGETFLQTLLS